MVEVPAVAISTSKAAPLIADVAIERAKFEAVTAQAETAALAAENAMNAAQASAEAASDPAEKAVKQAEADTKRAEMEAAREAQMRASIVAGKLEMAQTLTERTLSRVAELLNQ